MAWSKSSGALAAALLWAGAAWSQQPTTLPKPAKAEQPGERIMTVWENGKALRCRVLTTWQLEDGTLAYQLQVLETGELLTIVEAGPSQVVSGPSPGSRLRALQMNIFHWGRSRTPPPGVPVPPLGAIPASGVVEERIVGPVPEGLESGAVIVQHSSPAVGTPIVTGPPRRFGERLQQWLSFGRGHSTPVVSETVISSQPVPAGGPGAPSEKAFSTASPVLPPAVPSLPLLETSKSGETGAPKNWREMWGKSKESTAKLPGKTPSDKAAAPAARKAEPKSPVKQASTIPPASVAEKQPKKDILMAPERFNPDLEKKGVHKDTTVAIPPIPGAPLDSGKAKPSSVTPPPTSAAALAPGGGAPQMPLGAASVLAAGSNVPTRLTYVPVPVVTVPQPYRPPAPPEPKLPEAPQLNHYVNAFTPKSQPNGPQAPGMMPGPQGMMPRPQGMMPGPQAMMPPYGYPAAYGYAGYRPPVPPGMMAQPYQPVGMVNPSLPGGMVPYVPVTGRPVAQMNHPTTYQGPLPPNPFAGAAPGPFAPVGYMPQYMPMPMAYGPPMMDPRMAQQAQHGAQLQAIAQLVNVLRDSPYPAQREWAATALAGHDHRSHPQVMQELLTAAQKDPAASVRAGCVYQLGRLGVTTEPVLATLRGLRHDADPRVRYEVEQTLSRLAPGQAPAGQQQVLPASKVGN